MGEPAGGLNLERDECFDSLSNCYKQQRVGCLLKS